MEQTNRDALTILGAVLVEHRRYEQARPFFEALQKDDPRDAYSRRALALIQVETERYEPALASCDACLEAESLSTEDEATVMLLKARALWGLDRKDEAHKVADRFLALREKLTMRTASGATAE